MKLNHFSLNHWALHPLPLNLAVVAGLNTWLLVFGLTLYTLYSAGPGLQANSLVIVLAFIAFLFAFVGSMALADRPQYVWLNRALLVAQLAAAFVAMWYLPAQYLSILTIIWVTLLPNFVSLRNAILILLAVVSTWFWVYSWRWPAESVVQNSLLFLSFHVFALFTRYQAIKAEAAKARANRLNNELLATQQLLGEASRQNERTRIARDLHDLLGHHLTALTINLQVAEHLTEGEAQAKVEQCRALAKLLLSDVREAVSSLRDNDSLDLTSTVALMIANLPGLKVHSDIEAELRLDDLDRAHTLLSCMQEAMTNSLRHSGAKQFWLKLQRRDQWISLELFDDGQAPQPLVPGNGLNGMRERVLEQRGSLALAQRQGAVQINILLPTSGAVRAA